MTPTEIDRYCSIEWIKRISPPDAEDSLTAELGQMVWSDIADQGIVNLPPSWKRWQEAPTLTLMYVSQALRTEATAIQRANLPPDKW